MRDSSLSAPDRARNRSFYGLHGARTHGCIALAACCWIEDRAIICIHRPPENRITMAFNIFPSLRRRGNPTKRKAKPTLLPVTTEERLPASAREAAAAAELRPGRRAKSRRSRVRGARARYYGDGTRVSWNGSPVESDIRGRRSQPGPLRRVGKRRTSLCERPEAPRRAPCSNTACRRQRRQLSPLAWLALFDLLQRANDHAAFDKLRCNMSSRLNAQRPRGKNSAYAHAQGRGRWPADMSASPAN